MEILHKQLKEIRDKLIKNQICPDCGQPRWINSLDEFLKFKKLYWCLFCSGFKNRRKTTK